MIASSFHDFVQHRAAVAAVLASAEDDALVPTVTLYVVMGCDDQGIQDESSAETDGSVQGPYEGVTLRCVCCTSNNSHNSHNPCSVAYYVLRLSDGQLSFDVALADVRGVEAALVENNNNNNNNNNETLIVRIRTALPGEVLTLCFDDVDVGSRWAVGIEGLARRSAKHRHRQSHQQTHDEASSTCCAIREAELRHKDEIIERLQRLVRALSSVEPTATTADEEAGGDEGEQFVGVEGYTRPRTALGRPRHRQDGTVSGTTSGVVHVDPTTTRLSRGEESRALSEEEHRRWRDMYEDIHGGDLLHNADDAAAVAAGGEDGEEVDDDDDDDQVNIVPMDVAPVSTAVIDFVEAPHLMGPGGGARPQSAAAPVSAAVTSSSRRGRSGPGYDLHGVNPRDLMASSSDDE
eukprot:PhM_4_TR17881/c0_g2_i1/m.78328